MTGKNAYLVSHFLQDCYPLLGLQGDAVDVTDASDDYSDSHFINLLRPTSYLLPPTSYVLDNIAYALYYYIVNAIWPERLCRSEADNHSGERAEEG